MYENNEFSCVNFKVHNRNYLIYSTANGNWINVKLKCNINKQLFVWYGNKSYFFIDLFNGV